jgi:hypothetical protein
MKRSHHPLKVKSVLFSGLTTLPYAKDRKFGSLPEEGEALDGMRRGVGVQWELREAVARRDQSHALSFFLNPGP